MNSSNILAWTNNSTSTSVTKTGLTLNHGVTYYTSARAIDVAGNISDTISTDGITIDRNAPELGYLSDGLNPLVDLVWSNDTTSFSFNFGGIYDSLSGLREINYALGTCLSLIHI